MVLNKMPSNKIKKTNIKKKDNVLKELFGTLPKLKNVNLKKVRKELSPDI